MFSNSRLQGLVSILMNVLCWLGTFIFDQLLLKVPVTQSVISQFLFWWYNNGELVKTYNFYLCYYIIHWGMFPKSKHIWNAAVVCVCTLQYVIISMRTDWCKHWPYTMLATCMPPRVWQRLHQFCQLSFMQHKFRYRTSETITRISKIITYITIFPPDNN